MTDLHVAMPPFPRPLPELDVEPDEVGDYAADLLAASSQLDDAGEYSAGTGRIADWTGDAAEAYRADLAPYGYRADALSLALRGVARRVDTHASTMTGLLQERADLDTEGGRLSAQIFELEDDVRAFRTTVAAGGFGDTVVASRLQELRLRSLAIATLVRDLDGRNLAWWARVVEEEQAMVAAFARVLEVDQAERHYGGLDDPADEPLGRLPDPDADPEEVRRWWESLTPEQMAAIIAAAPGAIGNRDGIPAGARDEANRNRMLRDLARLRMLAERGLLTPAEEWLLENAEAPEEAVAKYDGDPDPLGHPVPALLWTYDPGAFAHDGRADGAVAIAVGDPDTADNVAVNVAGVGSDGGDIGTYTDRAWYLHQSATTADPTQTYASIAWLGYDAPDEKAGAVGEDAATAGGARLADALAGRAAGRDDDPRIVPIGHSYGSTTLGATLSDHDVDVDAAVVVGSPGLTSDVHNAGDLDVPDGHFYVGRNHDDDVARLGQNGSLGTDTLGGAGLGHDPADGDFRAERFQANAGPGADDHSSYYDLDSESLHNLGRIVAGEEPTAAAPVSDPWYGPADDPEEAAPSDLHDTDRDDDTDGRP